MNDARIFFDQIQMVYKFFKKYRAGKVYGGTKLKKFIDTRWAGHIKSTVAVHDNYEEIISSLEEIQTSVENGHEIKFDSHNDEIPVSHPHVQGVTTAHPTGRCAASIT